MVSEIQGLIHIFDEMHVGRAPAPSDITGYSRFYKAILEKTLNLFFVDVIKPLSSPSKAKASIQTKLFGGYTRLRGAEALAHQISIAKREYGNPKADKKDATLLKPLKQLKFGLSLDLYAEFEALMASLVAKAPTTGMKKLLDNPLGTIPITSGDGVGGSAKHGGSSGSDTATGSSSCSTLAKPLLTVASSFPKVGTKTKASTDHAQELKAKMAKFFISKSKRTVV